MDAGETLARLGEVRKDIRRTEWVLLMALTRSLHRVPLSDLLKNKNGGA